MIHHGQRRSPPSCSPPPHRLRGFTLLGLGLAVLCVGLASYIALSEVRKFQHRSQREQFIEELRKFATAFETYRNTQGVWPVGTNGESKVPRGMETSLANSTWLSGPPFGGSYEWIPPARTEATTETAGQKPAPVALIAVTAYSPRPPLALSLADLLYLDEKIDDGSLSTGRFRTGFNGWPVYHVVSDPNSSPAPR